MPKKILIQLDCDPQPSTFDAVVAVDAGADVLLRHGGVTVENVVSLVHGGMFTRGGDDLASTAIFRLPSVPFLKPIGADRPEASSRCTWLSVVRAPMAPHEIRSPMYCGEITSRNSLPAGKPMRLMSISS